MKEKALKWWESLGEVDKRLTYKERIYYSPLQVRPDKPSEKQIIRMYKEVNNINLSIEDYE